MIPDKTFGESDFTVNAAAAEAVRQLKRREEKLAITGTLTSSLRRTRLTPSQSADCTMTTAQIYADSQIHFRLNTSTSAGDISGCSSRKAGRMSRSKFFRNLNLHSRRVLA